MEVALIGPYGRIVLGATRVTIGQAPDNTLVLTDPKVSAHHIEVRPEGPYYSLVDLSNGYGTFVNEQLTYAGMSRILQPGDMIRIGDTKFTFTVDSGAQKASSGEYAPMSGTIPDQLPPYPPNSMINTAYGMGDYSVPPPPPPPDQPPIYPNTPMPGYMAAYGGAPAPPPGYPAPYSGTQYPVPPRKRTPVVMIVATVLAALIILAGGIGFIAYHTNQVAQDNIHATATSVQTQANNHATATVVDQQNATATAVAIPGLTATAAATSHYAPFTTVALGDPLTSASGGWNEGTACQFSAAGYKVSDSQSLTIQYCADTTDQYTEMAYQVMMTIHTGDCGGLAFRYNDVDNLYIFEVCQDGTYELYSHIKGQWNYLYPSFLASSAIKTGLDAQNLLAVTLKGDTINVYVNGTRINAAVDANLNGATVKQGHIGMFANNRGKPTSVIYTNALVWTM